MPPTEVSPDAPEWFRRAVDVPYADGVVEVERARRCTTSRGRARAARPRVIHGGGAHAHWWTHVAATFAPHFHVVAIDLTGHGDSGHPTL